jgi:hypothetical protein
VSARCGLRTRVGERERGREGGGHQPQRSPNGGARPTVEEIGAEPTRSGGGGGGRRVRHNGSVYDGGGSVSGLNEPGCDYRVRAYKVSQR